MPGIEPRYPRHVQQATAIRDAQKSMHNWFEQSAAERAASKVGGDPDINSGLTRWTDRFRQSVTDDLHGIANRERGLSGTISPVGAYEVARLSRAAASITEGALTLGRPVVNADGSHSFVGKGLERLLHRATNRAFSTPRGHPMIDFAEGGR